MQDCWRQTAKTANCGFRFSILSWKITLRVEVLHANLTIIENKKAKISLALHQKANIYGDLKHGVGVTAISQKILL